MTQQIKDKIERTTVQTRLEVINYLRTENPRATNLDLRKAGIVPEYYQPATVNRIMQSIDIKRDVVKYWRTK